mmetsp:Transcript_5563/g.18476  ORF Transcript_5563/g.18476 Transcript_5563/m.18476 type:complete len:396 (+) Transcript_5563:334-1521(+)
MRVCRLVRHQHLSPRVRVKRRPAHGTRWHRDTGVRIQLLGRERSRLRWRVHAVRQGRCQPRWYPRRQVGGRRRVRRALERTALGACRLQRAGDGALPLPRTQRRPTPKLAGGHVAADLGPVGRVGAAHTPRRRRRRQQHRSLDGRLVYRGSERLFGTQLAREKAVPLARRLVAIPSLLARRLARARAQPVHNCRCGLRPRWRRYCGVRARHRRETRRRVRICARVAAGAVLSKPRVQPIERRLELPLLHELLLLSLPRRRALAAGHRPLLCPKQCPDLDITPRAGRSPVRPRPRGREDVARPCEHLARPRRIAPEPPTGEVRPGIARRSPHLHPSRREARRCGLGSGRRHGGRSSDRRTQSQFRFGRPRRERARCSVRRGGLPLDRRGQYHNRGG